MITITILEKKQDEFVKMVSERHPNISILSDYEHCNKPVRCYCNKHDYYFEITPRNLGRIKENGGCQFCVKERGDSTARLTHNEFVDRVKKRLPDVQIIGKYRNHATKIECYCKKHDYTWMAIPKVLLDGSGCKKCGIEKASLSRTCTQEEFEDKVKSIFPNIDIIGKYTNALSNIECKCTIHNYYWKPTPASLLWGEGCPKCGNASSAEKNRYTQDEYENIVYKENPWLNIISTYKDLYSSIQCKCKKCNGEFEYNARTIMSPITCPICNNRKTASGVNDLATTHPYVVKYLKEKNDAYRYRYNSAQKTIFKCPICGDEKELKIVQTIRNGYHCTFCDEGISTPNRIIRNLLKKLDANNRHFEYSPDWAGRYRYDAYFEKDGASYVVEMDGSFHYIDYPFDNGNTLEDTQRRDKEKNILAEEHGIIMIRIKCVPETLSNITSQIKQSLLNKIFDLNNINWRELLYYNQSLFTEICDCYNNSNNKTISSVVNQLNLNKNVVSKYLYRGNDIGLCCYPFVIDSINV